MISMIPLSQCLHVGEPAVARQISEVPVLLYSCNQQFADIPHASHHHTEIQKAQQTSAMRQQQTHEWDIAQRLANDEQLSTAWSCLWAASREMRCHASRQDTVVAEQCWDDWSRNNGGWSWQVSYQSCQAAPLVRCIATDQCSTQHNTKILLVVAAYCATEIRYTYCEFRKPPN